MAKLHIREYAELANSGPHGFVTVPIGKGPGVAQTPLDIPPADSPAQSDPFAATTKFVRVHAKAACLIEIGNGAATSDSIPLAANQTEFFSGKEGETLSVITQA